MLKRIIFALALTLQIAAVAGTHKIVPTPDCWPCTAGR